MTNIPSTGTDTAPKRSKALLPLDLIRGFLIGSAELVPGSPAEPLPWSPESTTS